MAKEVEDIEGRLINNVTSASGKWAADTEVWMKANAPWQDESGYAREGLYAEAYQNWPKIDFKVSHSDDLENSSGMNYSHFLELGTYKMVPLPIIRPTLEIRGPLLLDYYDGAID